MSTQNTAEQRILFSIPALAIRWGVSRDTVKRLIASDRLRAVRIGARRMIHVTEIQRAERNGLSCCRKSKRNHGSLNRNTAAQN